MSDLSTQQDKASRSQKELAAVRALAEPLARMQGVEIADVEWVSSPRGRILRVSIEREQVAVEAGSDDAGSDDAGSDDAGSDDAGSDDAARQDEATALAEATALVEAAASNPGEQAMALAGVTLEDCVRVSRDLSMALDMEEPIAAAFRLEVSSPGLDRPLRRLRDFVRHIGLVAKVKLREPAADGQKVLRGQILSCRDVSADENADSGNAFQIVMQVDGKEHVVTMDNIVSARLVYEPLKGQKRGTPRTAERKKSGAARKKKRKAAR